MTENARPKKSNFELDYYALLGVTRDATNEDIQKAYRKLAKTFHPDKFADNPDDKTRAEARFIELREASETLTDETKRKIYDLYGIHGLKNMQVGEKLKTTEEIMREFDRLQRRKEEAFLERRVAPQGAFNTVVDVSEAIANRTVLPPEMSIFSLKQRVKVPFNKFNTLYAKAEVSSTRGAGAGTFTTDYEKLFGSDAKLSVSASTSLAKNSVVISGWRRFSPLMEGAIRWSIPISKSHLQVKKGGIDLTLARILAPSWTGVAVWSYDQSYKLSLRKSLEHSHLDCILDVRTNVVALAGVAAHHMNKQTSLNAMLTTWFDVSGIGAAVGGTISRQISHLSKGSITFRVGTNGVELSISYSRFGQKFTLPIRVAPDLTWFSGVVGLLTPLLVSAAAKYLWLDPARARKEQKKLERTRRERETFMRKQKERADSFRTLMQTAVERKLQDEENKNGLVIVHASYGKLRNRDEANGASAAGMNEEENDPFVIDVTMPVQFLVENSQLHIATTTKSSLVGFYDPCPGEEKYLEVIYLFRNKLHRVVVHDSQPVRAPVQAHLSPEVTAE